MNTYFKVEVDDYFPLSLMQNISVLPTEIKKGNIWCLLILKAVLKFFHLMKNPNQPTRNPSLVENLAEESDASVIYSLTGFLHVEISLNDRNFVLHEMNQMLEESLCDKNYTGNKIKIIAVRDNSQTLALNTFEPPVVRFSKDKTGSDSLRNGSEVKNVNAFNRDLRLAMLNWNGKSSNIEVPPFYSFDVSEFFKNGDFNLAFARDFTEEEFIIHRKYEQMLNVKTHFMNKEDIIKLKKQRRDLRFKLKEIEKRKIEFISKSNKTLNLVSLSGGPELDGMINLGQSYTSKEVKIAKTCIKYDMSKPPNFIDINDLRWDESSMISGTKQNFKEVDQVVANINKSLSDFSSREGAVLCENRLDSRWIETSALPNLFNKLIVFYNPNNFGFKEYLEMKEEDNYSIAENKEVLIVKKNESKGASEQVELLVNIQFAEVDSEINYFQLQIYDFETFEPIQELPVLRGINRTMRVRLPNEDQTFRLKLMSQSKAHLTIYSDSQISFFSVSTYLTDVENWKESKIKVTSGFMCANFHYILQKTSIFLEEGQHVIFHFPGQRIAAIKNVLRFDLVKTTGKIPTDMNQQIEKNSECLKLETNLYENIKLKKGSYMFVAHCQPDSHLAEQSFEISILSKKGIQVESVLNWTSNEILDFYQPNRYCQIFKEDLFFKQEILHLSISLEIKSLQNAVNNLSDKKTTKNDKSEIDLENYQSLENPLRVYIEVYRNEKLVNVFAGKNGVKVLDLQIVRDSSTNESQVLLVAKFMAKDDSRLLTVQPFSQKLTWILKLSSNALLCVVKNTKKEELENQAIKSWEVKENGRAEKALKIRQKNLALIKLSTGELLTEKENQLIGDEAKGVLNLNPKAQINAKVPIQKMMKNGNLNLEYLENPGLIKLPE